MTTPVAPEESGNPRDGDAAESSIQVRELAESDSVATVGLLTRGLWDRSTKYWRRALKRSDVTFVNISPARRTFMTIEAQGFVRYVEGTMLALAALCPFRPAAEITRDAPSFAKDVSVTARHAALGCLTDEVAYRGEIHPFVFLPRLSHRSRVKFVQLVYCRDVADYVRFAGPLGRTLLRIGFFFVILDAVGRAKGLPGRYLAGQKVKRYRGPAKPRLSDLSESELVWFGL